MRSALLLLVATSCMTTGCVSGLFGPGPKNAPRDGQAVCEQPSYDRKQLSFRCGDATYDLLGEPVRSERVFDIVTRAEFTRRHYVTRVGARRLAYKTVQLQGERFPRKVMLETQRGFRRVLLDRQGNILVADRAQELGQ